VTVCPGDKKVKVILNADDYALSPAISRCILDLIEGQRLSATSVMTASPYWADWGKAIAAYAGAIDVGLHFSLTELAPLSGHNSIAGGAESRSFGNVAIRAGLNLISAHDIRSELFCQWDAFVRIVGRPPSHVDGHQHIHQLPGVCGPLISAIKEISENELPYIRTCSEDFAAIVKRRVCSTRAAILSAVGGRLRTLATDNGLAINNGFTGIYNFSLERDYRQLMPKFLVQAKSNTILLCHPGLPDTQYRQDPIANARMAEYRFFSSPEFLDLLGEEDIRLGRFSEP
jgi:chitin disaccharide deacetylase